MEVLIGDRVRWESCEGTKRGEVVAIYNALDAFGDVINFYHIEYSDGFGGTTLAMLAETELHNIEFKVIFRDVAIQIARGEKAIEDSWARNPDRSGGQYTDAEILQSYERW